MIVFILERVSESLRGELTRWMLEPKACVFVGTTSAQVREKLWQRIVDDLGPSSGALLVHNDPTSDWGFRLRTHGTLRRRIVERDGLQLVEYNHPDAEKARRKLRASIPPKLRELLASQLQQPEAAPPSAPPGTSDASTPETPS